MLGSVRLVIRTWSYSIEVFLRSGFGSRYAVLESLLVIPLVLDLCGELGRNTTCGR